MTALMRIAGAACLAVAALAAGMGTASAQISNSPFTFSTRSSPNTVLGSQPFAFRSRGLGDAVGMSLAYRQAILNAELNDSHPDNLVRGPAGQLLDVQRYDGQAIVSEQAAPFLPGFGIGLPATTYAAGPAGTFVDFGGISIGFGGAAIGVWTGAASHDFRALSLDSYVQVARAQTPLARPSPIDAWVNML